MKALKFKNWFLNSRASIKRRKEILHEIIKMLEWELILVVILPILAMPSILLIHLIMK